MWTSIQIVSRSLVLSLVLFCGVLHVQFFFLIVPVFSSADKMFKKFIWVLGLTTSMVLVDGESPRETLRDTSFLRLFNKHISTVHAPRMQWTYRPQEDSHRHAFEGISHGSTLKATVSSFERQNEPQEYWWSNSGWQNFTGAIYRDHSKLSRGYVTGVPRGATELFYKDSAEKIRPRYPHQQIRPTTSSHVAIKKNYSKLQVPIIDASGKPKFKKMVLHPSPSDYKKVVLSRVTKPYAKHKYPSQSHPLYRRYYYQSPYQRYAIPSNEMLRFKEVNPNGGYYKASMVPNQDFSRHYTTERMDDIYPDGAATWEDYFAYDDRNQTTSGSYDEEIYTEVEKRTSRPEENTTSTTSTTRGYYGDRIYMSTQVPLVASEKTGVKNKYFIIRRTPHDDDVETLFE